MAITIKAKFKCSSERISQVPKDDFKDIAFIGRSNVGKSSLVNMLTGIKGLAKVSGTPGKTKLINHFTCVEERTWRVFEDYHRLCAQMREATLPLCACRLTPRAPKNRP